MFDFGLSTQQLTVISALSNGATMTAAAQEAGVHRNTIIHWLRNLLPFQQALNDAQYTRALLFREKIEDLVDLAIQTIQSILADPTTPPSVRLKAALTIVQTATTPPAPKKRLQIDIEKVVIHRTPVDVREDQLQPAEEPKPQSENSTNLHNSAQPVPDIRVNSRSFAADSLHNSAQAAPPATPKVGRNEPCPCGSGLKFKRCCLNKPHSKAA